MNFKIDKTTDMWGASLIQAVSAGPCPTITANFTKMFGKIKGLRQKYSDIVVVRHTPTGELYTVYACFGEFRVGGWHDLPMTALGELLELLDPVQFAGATGKSADELINREQFGLVPKAPAAAEDNDGIPY